MMRWETCRALIVEICVALAVVAATAFTSARIETGAAGPGGAGLARIALDAAGTLSPSRAVVWTPAFGTLAGAALVDHGQSRAHIDRLLARPTVQVTRSRRAADGHESQPSRPAGRPAS